MTAFDPSARATSDSGIFGLPFSASESQVVLIPVPWEATTSYGSGTSKGPAAILEASRQVDLFDLEYGKAYEKGFHLLPHPKEVASLNKKAKIFAKQARQIEDQIAELQGKSGGAKALRARLNALEKRQKSAIDAVNASSLKVNEWVYQTSKHWLAAGKFVGLVGGDHSSPYGLIRALSEKWKGEFGVLHIDAHHDLRDAYEGFQFSHASIFHNVMESKWAPKKLVQVGIRDFSEDEHNYAKRRGVKVFYDLEVQRWKASGETWMKVCERIIKELPEHVYISFDIDGLSPAFCPHTGTPVPGGLDFHEALILLKALKDANRKLIGFDLNEVAPGEDEWDANVGARMLYKLCCASVAF